MADPLQSVGIYIVGTGRTLEPVAFACLGINARRLDAFSLFAKCERRSAKILRKRLRRPPTC